MRICLLVLRLKIKNRVVEAVEAVEAVEVVEAVSWCFCTHVIFTCSKLQFKLQFSSLNELVLIYLQTN
jgi:hypothetical protein